MNKRILITGSSVGLVASALSEALAEQAYDLCYLTRDPKEGNEYYWDPKQGVLDTNALEGVSYLVHLAGAPINGARWSRRYKREIMESRVMGAQLLREAFRRRGQILESYLTASAVGYYGLTASNEPLTESAPAGDDFLAQVCVAWEMEADKFVKEGVASRALAMRFGVVLHPNRGALPKMLTLSQTGVYVVMGSGKQYLPWIDYRDLGALLAFALTHRWAGVYNAVAPDICTYSAFINRVRKVRCGWLTVRFPAWFLRLLLGESSGVVLYGVPVSPAQALADGFQFTYATLERSLLSVALNG